MPNFYLIINHSENGYLMRFQLLMFTIYNFPGATTVESTYNVPTLYKIETFSNILEILNLI